MARTGRRLEIFPDADRMEDALLRAAEHSAFVDATSYLTFTQLIERLGLPGLSQAGRRVCPPLTARVLVWACAQELGPGPFGTFIAEPAFARDSLELFAELKGSAVTPRQFADAIDQLDSGRVPRARYLAALYAAYERRLAAAKLADREDLIRSAIDALERQGPPPVVLREAAGIIVRDLHDLPASRLALLLALARRCDREELSFILELPGAGTTEVDMAVDPILGAFEREAQTLRTVEAHKTDYRLEGRPLAYLGDSLFSSRMPKPEDAAPSTSLGPNGSPTGPSTPLGPNGPPTGPSTSLGPNGPPLKLLAAATAREETRALAREVAAQIAAGTPPEQIAVAFRDLGEEAEMVAEELEQLGIPARVRRGVPLTSTAAGRTALSLPLLIEEGFPATAVARLLASRYAPKVARRCPDGAATLLAAASVRDDRIGAELGPGGQKGAYAVRLDRFAARHEERDPKTAARARELLACCEKLIAECKRLPEEATVGDFLERWWRTVEAIGLVEAVHRVDPRLDDADILERAALQAMARDQAALEALRALLEELREALRGSLSGERKISRRTFHRWLHDAAADFNLPAAGPRTGAVRLLDARELPGRRYAYLCLGGIVDGRFPGRSTPHPLFSDDDRRRVNATLGRPVFRLATGDLDGRAPWRLAEDRLLFFLALTATEGGATLSFARTSAGQEQLPSPFLDELRRLTNVREIPLAPFPVPPVDEVYSETDLRLRTAIEVIANEELRISKPDAAKAVLDEKLGQEPWFAYAAEVAKIETERLRAFADDDRPATAYTGLIDDPVLRPLLSELLRFGPEKPLSASSLNRFGNCAFQGFLADVLRLGEPETPGEEIDSRGQGSFWHKVLEVLIPKLRAAGLLRKPVEEIPDALLDEALQAGAAHVEQSAHVGHPALWKLGRDRARLMVARVLSSEAQGMPFPGLEPAETELRFGNAKAKDPWRTVVIPGVDGEPPIHLEGTIDRLDTGPDGRVAIVDYKSGGLHKTDLKEKLLTRDFQLPLYLYAARAAGRPDAVHAAWLSLKDGEVTTLDKVHDNVEELLSDDPRVQAQVEAAGGANLPVAVRKLVSGLRQGQFPAHSHECEYCAYRAVCRVSKRRVEEAA